MIQKILLISLNILLANLAQGQDLITKTEKTQVVDKVSSLLIKRYIFQEEGMEMSKKIRTNLENGEYDNINDKFIFSEKLTSDMRGVFPDKHLGLVYKPWAQMKRDSVKAVETMSKSQVLETNVLPDNIGYLAISSFTFKLSNWDNAMSQLSKCSAILIDIRNNRGGSGYQESYAISYFLPGGLHYSTTHNRQGKEYKVSTRQKIKGERKPDIPLVILIDKYTFSAAEGFAYQLQSLGRATIVGEQSAGGARPKRNFNVNHSFFLSLSISRIENAITHTDWEGVGVIPDLEVNPESALEVGVMTAKKLITTHSKQ